MELKIFKNKEFGRVRTTVIDREPWFVGKDVAEILGYENQNRDIIRHVDSEDRYMLDGKTQYQHSLELGQRGGWLINESGLYSLVLSSKLPKAKEFKRWVTSEVLPFVRKNGVYMQDEILQKTLEDPTFLIDILTNLKKAKAENSCLKLTNDMQSQQLLEYKPKVDYLDKILQSQDTVTVSQIAADYGISAKKLNEILNEEKIQYNVDGQWLLYQKHRNKGWTKSETIDIKSSKEPKVKMFTKWTQKGRLEIHKILTMRGIKANMDKDVEEVTA